MEQDGQRTDRGKLSKCDEGLSCTVPENTTPETDGQLGVFTIYETGITWGSSGIVVEHTKTCMIRERRGKGRGSRRDRFNKF